MRLSAVGQKLFEPWLPLGARGADSYSTDRSAGHSAEPQGLPATRSKESPLSKRPKSLRSGISAYPAKLEAVRSVMPHPPDTVPIRFRIQSF